MLCKQCGFGLGKQANFCPSCGNKVTDEDRKTGHTSNPAKWLKILSGLILAGLIAIFLTILFSDNMTETVSGQLKAIKEDRLTEAYDSYTSRLFKEATSLEQFKEFLKSYPVFSKNVSVRFIDRNSEHDRGVLQALISNSEGVETPVHYQMVKENDEWLIENIKLVNPSIHSVENSIDRSKASDVFDSKPIETVIQEPMELIRGHNLKKAYEGYTSSEFRKTTTYEEFEEFIKNNPIFSDNVSLRLHDLSFDNNMATIIGTLKDAGGAVASMEYDLVQENGDWKITHVKTVNSEDASGMVFSKFAVGSAIGEDNLVSSPQTVLKSKLEDIYFNLYVDSIKAGTEIRVVFEHLDSYSKIDPVSQRVSDDGSVILTFIFSPPSGGWPKGNYRLLVTSSIGVRGSYDFKMEG